ncbi:MAG: hypothetical protein ACP5Q5_05415 [Brevinematia bacterium]
MKKFFLILLLFVNVCFSKVMHFSWKSAGEKYSYKIQISYDNLFKKIFIEEIVKKNEYISDIPPGKYFFRVIPILRGFEGDPSLNISFEISSDASENLKNIEPPEVLESIIVSKEEKLILKPVFKNKVANVEYNVNEIKNFRLISNQIEINTTSMKDGEHSLYYRTDYNSKKSKIKELNFKIDRTPPQVIISVRFKKIGQREYVYPDSKIEINISDNNLKETFLWVNSKRINTNIINVGFDLNFIRLTIFASDSNDNVTTFTRNYYVDTKPPEIKFENVLKTPSLNINIQDETEIKERIITINDKKYFTNQIDLNFFKSGTYVIKISAIDIFENTNIINLNMRIKNEKDWEGFIEQ